jgi:hypothetical protein
VPPTSSYDEDGEFIVGGAEIRVAAPSGVIFAGPDMIIHYVMVHGYKPPEKFPDALLMQDVASSGQLGARPCREIPRPGMLA